MKNNYTDITITIQQKHHEKDLFSAYFPVEPALSVPGQLRQHKFYYLRGALNLLN